MRHLGFKSWVTQNIFCFARTLWSQLLDPDLKAGTFCPGLPKAVGTGTIIKDKICNRPDSYRMQAIILVGWRE